MQLSIIIAFLMSVLSAQWVTDNGTVPNEWLGQWAGGFSQGWGSVCLVIGTILFYWSLTRVTVKVLLGRMKRLGFQDHSTRRMQARTQFQLQVLILVLFAGQLTVGGWAGFICLDLGLGGVAVLWEAALILPFIAMLLIKWDGLYAVNHFERGSLVSEQLAEGHATRPIWSKRQYMVFQIRHGLLILLVPLLLIFGLRDLAQWAVVVWFGETEGSLWIIEGVFTGVVVMVFILSPLLLRYIWSTRSLPTGPLRERLESFCRVLKMGYRDILLWDTYSAVANAAVMGVIRPVRFLLLSDALIENMKDEEIEAVFGHEAGHVKHHHILFLVLGIVGFGMVGMALLQLVEGVWSNMGAQAAPWSWLVYGSGPIMIVMLMILFGWISRRFEAQADVHAALTVGQLDTASNRQDNFQSTKGLSPHGAQVMGSALRRIAVLNGISAVGRSWRHGSISGRIAFLEGLAREDGLLNRFSRKVLVIKAAIVLSVILGAAGCWLLNN